MPSALQKKQMMLKKQKDRLKQNAPKEKTTINCPPRSNPSGSGKCWITVKFDGKEDTVTFVTDDCKIDLDKKVNGYFVIHGFLSEE